MEEGVDYLLACDIINVAPVQNLKVKWYYGSEVTQIQTFNKTSAAPVNVSSTFNVTGKREHNGERFRCEAELDLGPNGPQPLPRVAAEAPSPAVVQCEFSTFYSWTYFTQTPLFILICFCCTRSTGHPRLSRILQWIGEHIQYG